MKINKITFSENFFSGLDKKLFIIILKRIIDIKDKELKNLYEKINGINRIV